MIKTIKFWLGVSRPFSLPITVLGWLVIFTYSLKFNGDLLNGILALIGIAFAHLATNLFDDYIDYKSMLKCKNMMSTVVKNKCEYLVNGTKKLEDVLRVVIIYCAIALAMGLILFIRSGFDVLWLMLIGGILTLSYPFMSQVGLSEVAVGIAFGPLFFEGVYYVMTRNFSFDVFILSIAVGAFIVGVLYVHTSLDYDCDMVSHKKTLCCRFGDKFKGLYFLYGLFAIGYLSILWFGVVTENYWVIGTFLTLPYSISLCKSLKNYHRDKSIVPVPKWWQKPLDNWENLVQNGTASFYFVLFMSRNLVVWFCLILIFALILG